MLVIFLFMLLLPTAQAETWQTYSVPSLVSEGAPPVVSDEALPQDSSAPRSFVSPRRHGNHGHHGPHGDQLLGVALALLPQLKALPAVLRHGLAISIDDAAMLRPTFRRVRGIQQPTLGGEFRLSF